MRMNPMATEARETVDLIGSDKVEGTAVYDAKGEKMGSIERVMIEKRSGQVAYAVLSFGGFMGIGNDSYPIPWDALKYDTSLGGYRTNITVEKLWPGGEKRTAVQPSSWFPLHICGVKPTVSGGGLLQCPSGMA